MKLRFDHQSIRLRVRKSDLEKLSKEGFIEEIIRFPGSVLAYRLESLGTGASLTAEIRAENVLVIAVPAQTLSQWIDSEEVGIYAALQVASGTDPLQVILEKDFPCKHGTVEENADTFDELAFRAERHP